MNHHIASASNSDHSERPSAQTERLLNTLVVLSSASPAIVACELISDSKLGGNAFVFIGVGKVVCGIDNEMLYFISFAIKAKQTKSLLIIMDFSNVVTELMVLFDSLSSILSILIL